MSGGGGGNYNRTNTILLMSDRKFYCPKMSPMA